MKPVEPTKRDIRILKYIGTYVDQNGCGPSYADICAGVRLPSTASTTTAVRKLAKLGLLSYQPRTVRSIRLTPNGRLFVGLKRRYYPHTSNRELQAKNRRIAVLESQVTALKEALKIKFKL